MKTLHNENETTAATTVNLSAETQAPAAVAKPARIEAYGSKGMQNRPWRRTFASAEKLDAWCERNDAVVLGTRRVDSEQGAAVAEADQPPPPPRSPRPSRSCAPTILAPRPRRSRYPRRASVPRTVGTTFTAIKPLGPSTSS